MAVLNKYVFELSLMLLAAANTMFLCDVIHSCTLTYNLYTSSL